MAKKPVKLDFGDEEEKYTEESTDGEDFSAKIFKDVDDLPEDILVPKDSPQKAFGVNQVKELQNMVADAKGYVFAANTAKDQNKPVDLTQSLAHLANKLRLIEEFLKNL